MAIVSIVGIVCMITISVLVTAAIIRYAIDSSKTSKKIGDLIREVHALRVELKKQNEEKHIIDKRI